jgi:hypothetical protein
VRIALIALLVALAACGGGKQGCPPGQYDWHGYCVPITQLETEDADWELVPPETAEPTAEDAALPEEVTAAEEAGDEGQGEDVAQSEFQAHGQVGSPCSSPSQCDQGLTCLGTWLGGYCSKEDCDGSGGACPEGSACFSMNMGFKACLASCQGDADCRTDAGYRCKTLDGGGDQAVRLCWGTIPAAREMGAPCSKHDECAGSMVCNFAFPYGYCTDVLCDAEHPCAQGECVRLNGQPTCLKACTGDPDCKWQGDDYDLACKSARNFDNQQVKVCLSSVAGKPLGQACLSSFECQSGLCRILMRGRCGVEGSPCLADLDCKKPNDFCLMEEGGLFGLCTASCGAGLECEGTAQCLTKDGSTGECFPPCFQDASCPGEDAMQCVFGDPIASDVGSGQRVCFVAIPGEPGSRCTDDSECNAGDCLMGASGSGYCVKPCPTQLFSVCPFPMGCSSYASQKRCLKRCDPSAQDCPAGFTCAKPQGDSANLCVPAD